MPRRPHVRRLTQGPRPERAEHHGWHCRTSKEHPEQTLQLPHTAACPPITAWYRGIWLLAATTGHVSLSCEPRMPKAHLGFLAFGVTYSDNLGHAAMLHPSRSCPYPIISYHIISLSNLKIELKHCLKLFNHSNTVPMKIITNP